MKPRWNLHLALPDDIPEDEKNEIREVFAPIEAALTDPDNPAAARLGQQLEELTRLRQQEDGVDD